MHAHALLTFPVLLLLAFRGLQRKSVSPSGAIAGLIIGLSTCLHASPVYVSYLVTFYILGTATTKGNLVASDKEALGPQRNGVQVLANTLTPTLLVLYSLFLPNASGCFGKDKLADTLFVGIMAGYASATADTLSSELGMLSKSPPRMILSWRQVPAGTNGAASSIGILSGALGGLCIGLCAWVGSNPCSSMYREKDVLKLLPVAGTAGLMGTITDSILGGCLQSTQYDGKRVVEALNGGRLKANHKQRNIGGYDILTNNQVNFLTGMMTTFGTMAVFAACTRY